MILRGVLITATGVIDNHVIAPSAVDCSLCPPLLLAHRGAPIGQVLRLTATDSRVYAEVETDSPEALTLGYFSPGGRALERRRRDDGLWAVSEFKLQEVSVVKVPQNPDARITERRATDPFTALRKARLREYDLYIEAFQTLAKGLQAAARATKGMTCP